MALGEAESLLADIESAAPARGSVAVWWVGQSGFIIKGASGTIAIDTFLSDSGGLGRRYPPPLNPTAIRTLDLVMGTHDHIDHIDPIGFPAMLGASQGAVAVVPAPAVPRVVALGVPSQRVIGALANRVIELNQIRVHPLPAAHAEDPRSGYGFHLDDKGQHPYLSYVIEISGVRLYHAGDTVLYDGLVEHLQGFDLDVLLIPINGRSWYRERAGNAGNLNVFEASELARRSGARIVIPMHYDLFADNGEDVGRFVSHAAQEEVPVHVVALARGRRFDVYGHTN